MTDTLQRAPARQALLLIDSEDDFLGPQGKLPICRTQVAPVLAAAGRAVATAWQAGDFVLAIGNEFRPGDYLMNLLRRHASIAGLQGSQWAKAPLRAGIRYFPKYLDQQNGIGVRLSIPLRRTSYAEVGNALVVDGLHARDDARRRDDAAA